MFVMFLGVSLYFGFWHQLCQANFILEARNKVFDYRIAHSDTQEPNVSQETIGLIASVCAAGDIDVKAARRACREQATVQPQDHRYPEDHQDQGVRV